MLRQCCINKTVAPQSHNAPVVTSDLQVPSCSLQNVAIRCRTCIGTSPAQGLIRRQPQARDVIVFSALESEISTTSSASTSVGEDRPQRTAFSKPSVCTCPGCSGKGAIPCKACCGTGRLGRGGYNKKNTLNMARILSSKWTAMEETLGWRHFRVVQQRKGGGNLVFLLMQASCDNSAQLWVNSQILRDRSKWAAGWLQRTEMQDPEGTLAGTGMVCRVCNAAGTLPCPLCDASGVATINL